MKNLNDNQKECAEMKICGGKLKRMKHLAENQVRFLQFFMYFATFFKIV